MSVIFTFVYMVKFIIIVLRSRCIHQIYFGNFQISPELRKKCVCSDPAVVFYVLIPSHWNWTTEAKTERSHHGNSYAYSALHVELHM